MRPSWNRCESPESFQDWTVRARREHAQSGARELGPEEERLQARDDRVAAEDRHEPRHPGGRQLAEVAVGAHTQRREVADRTREAARQRIPARAELRHAELPGG